MKTLRHVVVISLLLTACGNTLITPSVDGTPTIAIGEFIPTGMPITRDLRTTTEPVWNCGEGGYTIVKNPSVSVTTNWDVE
jgi:hypothetical protein